MTGADAGEKPPESTGGKVLADRLSSVRLPFLVVPLFVLAGSAIVGNAAAPALLANRPLLLLALNATTRHLLLTSTSVDVVPYAAVALARRSLEDPLLYLLGWRYGDAAVAWTAEHLGGARALSWLQRNFRRFGWLLVADFPVPALGNVTVPRNLARTASSFPESLLVTRLRATMKGAVITRGATA